MVAKRFLAGIALLSYGLVVFGDEGLSELIRGGTEFKGNAVYPSPFILGSQWGFSVYGSLFSPYSGTAAVLGFLIGLSGVLLLRYRPQPRDYNDSQYVRAGIETFMCGCLWSATWCFLILAFQPAAFGFHVSEFLTGVSNRLLAELSICALAVASLVRLKLSALLEM